ncbi:MAG: HigA family addiction module antitoxin [Rhodoferax sp.]|uniref:HigA family addiction module antitoxin n=1 Tax=Rhodoferax sp. TaxID=50421 RepID=UPI002732A938|nr:HigA family addiction module antitoxin [Rhodoferax sp.]MDP2677734.1 HigA family addiction module antitoxin [Rhodoferax sp.]
MGITARQFAADMDVPPSRISDIVNAARPITADTALRLGLFFSMAPRYWLNLQTEYDMRTVTQHTLAKIAPRIRGVPACRSLRHSPQSVFARKSE